MGVLGWGLRVEMLEVKWRLERQGECGAVIILGYLCLGGSGGDDNYRFIIGRFQGLRKRRM